MGVPSGERPAGKLHADQFGGVLSVTLAQDRAVGLCVQLCVGLRALLGRGRASEPPSQRRGPGVRPAVLSPKFGDTARIGGQREPEVVQRDRDP